MSLTILCATRGEDRILPFLRHHQQVAQACGATYRIIADGTESFARLADSDLVNTVCLLALEGVHQAMQVAVDAADTDYVCVLDDDETCTPGLIRWLQQRTYKTSHLWSLPRAWLWGNTETFLSGVKHWPDYQTRLSLRVAAYVPMRIHGGWFDGHGTHCPYAIEHHKLLIRSREEREATVRSYEAVQAGAGMPKQYLPELRPIEAAPWPQLGV